MTAVAVAVVKMAVEGEVAPMEELLMVVPVMDPPPIVTLLLVREAILEEFAFIVVPEAVVKPNQRVDVASKTNNPVEETVKLLKITVFVEVATRRPLTLASVDVFMAIKKSPVVKELSN